MADEVMDYVGLLLVMESLVPGSAFFLDALIRGSRLLCGYLRATADENNARLCNLLLALTARVECERHKGLTATEGWAKRYQSLCNSIHTHVEETGVRRGSVTTLLTARKNARLVDAFNSEIEMLKEEITVSFKKE